MDWECYKQICDTPGVTSRWMIEQTQELVAPALAERLARALEATPIAKPDGHRGGPEVDMFALDLRLSEVAAISQAVEDAVLSGRRTRATAERGLGGFEESWREYRQVLEQGAAEG